LSKKFKKYSLKIEFLNIELEERDEMFKKYDEEFKKDFRDEIMFLNFSQNKEKKESNTIEVARPNPSKLSQKIYRNLAKILHPDVSQLLDAEVVFKQLSDYYEKDNLIGLIAMYNQYKSDMLDISDKEYQILEQKIKEVEIKIKSYENTLSWVWANANVKKPLLKQKFHELMKINKDEFEKWKNR
jgi:hypothetical protein|tara:strand:+ start:218 stop:772 length:555 start_codon:yes stop_codon:yes gene_type:complete